MCGIAGAYGVPNASYLVALMLKAMQHRGQEAAGIVSSDGKELHEHKALGLVDEVFRDFDKDDEKDDYATRLPGTVAIGHIRYATTGDPKNHRNIQPLVARRKRGAKAIVHNGNLTNYAEMRAKLENQGAIFRSTSDTELFLHLMARSNASTAASRLVDACNSVEGAYALLTLTVDTLVAAVDPLGFRPLAYAPYKGGTLFASETCAFDLFGIPAAEWKCLELDQMIEFTANGHDFMNGPGQGFSRHCSFEHIYFTRPDSKIFGTFAGAVRKKLGILLALESPAVADVVIAAPDSSNTMAAAYAQTLGIPFEFGLVRNHYTGRTFLTPTQIARELGVRMKLNADRSVVEGKRVVVIDDSIVRGTTATKMVELLRSAGATEVHIRIASPPVEHPCFWGIDTPNREELIAARKSVDELNQKIRGDSLAFLAIQSLRTALDDVAGERYCTTCFTSILPDDRLIPASSLFAKR